LNFDQIPTLRLSHLTGAERRAYILADNKLAQNAGWDREILALELQALCDLDFDVDLTGFGVAEIDIILEEANDSSPENPNRIDDLDELLLIVDIADGIVWPKNLTFVDMAFMPKDSPGVRR
jgi:hypothetical protein